MLFVVWECWIFARVLWWRDHDPQLTAFMRHRAEARQMTGQSPLQSHPWVRYEQIPTALKQAVVAAEDANFVAHHGFDWNGIHEAFNRDLAHQRALAGGSTITQQLAKNLFLSEQRSLWRKMQEALITLMLEGFWSKHRILEVYLNVIEWGDGLFGCAAAARHYFQTGVGGLSKEQAARLASMIPRPRYFDRHGDSVRLLRKTETIEYRMEQVVIPK